MKQQQVRGNKKQVTGVKQSAISPMQEPVTNSKQLVAKIKKDLDTMRELFGNYPKTELIYHTPFQLLMSVMLSAQTTDKQVNRVTEKFYDHIFSPQDVIRLGEEQLYSLISGVNYSKTKAKHIFETAILLHTTNPKPQCVETLGSLKSEVGGQYSIPSTLPELIKFPGVGIKTAKVVLSLLYQQQHIAVDTHVHRVAHRLGRVENLNPEKTSDALEILIPDTYKDRAHQVMIYFGRYLCKSKKPLCGECPLRKGCTYYKAKL